MSFEPDLTDPFVAKAAALRKIFHQDAVERDKRGGRPVEQIRQLKESGLPSAQIPVEYGGQGASWLSIMRVVREFARTDGSLAHLFGYHHLPLNLVLFRAADAQKDRWLRASAAQNWVWSNSGNAMSKKTSPANAPPTTARLSTASALRQLHTSPITSRSPGRMTKASV